MFLKISQNSQKNKVFFNKVAGLAKFLRTPFLHLRMIASDNNQRLTLTLDVCGRSWICLCIISSVTTAQLQLINSSSAQAQYLLAASQSFAMNKSSTDGPS